MKRRTFIATAGAGAVAAAASQLPKPAIAQGMRELKMVTTWPKNLPGPGTSAERLAQRITAASGGQLKVTVYAAGELVPPFESFDAVSNQTAEMYHAADYYFQGKSKAFNFFTTVPFGLTATEMDAWIHHGGGQELWDELSADFGIKPFAAGNTGVQMGGWFRKEINTLDDFQGLKMRMPGLGGEAIRRVGAAVVNLPASDIYASLQSGAIDATEWVGPWNDLALGLYKVASYYYYPGFHEPGSTLSCGIGRPVWESLSDEHKAIVESATAAENNVLFAEYNARNNEALETLINEHGVKLTKMPNDVINSIGEASGEVMAEVAADGGITKRVYDSFIEFRRGAMSWSRYGDQAFLEARLLPFTYAR